MKRTYMAMLLATVCVSACISVEEQDPEVKAAECEKMRQDLVRMKSLPPSSPQEIDELDQMEQGYLLRCG